MCMNISSSTKFKIISIWAWISYHIRSTRKHIAFEQNISSWDFLYTWPCLEHAIFYKNKFTRGRNLDQLMLCAVYAIAKVIDKEVQFRHLIACYKSLKLGPDMIFKRVFIGGRHYDTIITFYNALFMPMLKDFVLQFGLYLKDECAVNSSAALLSPSLQKLRCEFKRHMYWYDAQCM